MAKGGGETESDSYARAEREKIGGNVFLDSGWEKLQREYHQSRIDELNQLIRDYNIIAPEVSRRPRLRLERELEECFNDVALEVAGEIKMLVGGRQRDEEAKVKKPKAKVYDDARPLYGFKDMWREMWG